MSQAPKPVGSAAPMGGAGGAAVVAAANAAAQAAIPVPKNPQELEVVLMMMLQPDTQKIATAERMLKKFMQKSPCVPAMMQQIVGSGHAEARQMAAVLLRECIWRHWRKLKSDVQENVKQALMKRLLVEPQRLVRLALCGLVSAIARYLVPQNKWTQIIEFLTLCTKSNEPLQKEVGLMLFRTLAEFVGDTLKPQFHVYEAFFIRCMADAQHERLRLEALKGVQIFVDYITTKQEVIAFRDLIPAIVQTLQVSVAQDKQEAISVAFEILEILAESDKPFLTTHLPVLVKLMLEMAVNKKIDVAVRQNASSTVCAIAKRLPTQLTKHKLVEGILKAALMLIVEPFKDVFDATEMTPQKIGVELLDHVILSGVPKKNVYQICMKCAADLLRSASEHDRKGAFVILAVMAEGCADLLKDVLKPMLDTICNGIKDKSPVVRGAACVALSQFADHIQPDVTEHHQLVLPNLLLALDNQNESGMVKRKCCLALDVFCEHLGDEIVPYIQPLMAKLAQLLKTKDAMIQTSVISAIKSTAVAAGAAYKPYYADTLKIMMHLMTQTADDMLPLRCRATEAAGAIVVAVGKEVATANGVLLQLMKMAVDGMDLEYFELRDSTYQFFESVAECLGGKDFLPFLQAVMTRILATLHSDDGVIMHEQNQDINAGNRKQLLENQLPGEGDGDDEPDAQPHVDGDAQDDDDDDLTIERNVNFSIRSGALDEKTSALHAVCTIMEQVGAPFLLYMEKLLTELDEISVYPHYWIRMSVVEVYHQILNLLYRTFPNNPRKWAPGQPSQVHQNTRLCLDSMLPNLLARLEKDTHKETVSKSLDALTDLMKFFGPSAIQAHMKPLVNHLLALVNEKAPCQAAVEDDTAGDAKDEQDREYDELVIDSVTDTIGMAAQICGASFEPVFKQMVGPLIKLTGKTRPDGNRAVAIGCVAEVCNELGAAVKPYVPHLMPLVISMVTDASLLVKRNAAFCAGVLIEHGADAAFPFYEKTVQALAPAFDIAADKKDELDYYAVRDNAASALAKMIAHQPKALPLDKLLPLLWKACPLDVDHNECRAVYLCVLKLFTVAAQQMTPHIPTVVTIFARVLGQSEVPLDVRTHVLGFCKQIMAQLADKLQPTLGGWDAKVRDAFVGYVKGTLPLPAETDHSGDATHHKHKDDGQHRPGQGAAGQLSMSTLSNKPTPQSPAAAAPGAGGQPQGAASPGATAAAGTASPAAKK